MHYVTHKNGRAVGKIGLEFKGFIAFQQPQELFGVETKIYF